MSRAYAEVLFQFVFVGRFRFYWFVCLNCVVARPFDVFVFHCIIIQFEFLLLIYRNAKLHLCVLRGASTRYPAALLAGSLNTTRDPMARSLARSTTTRRWYSDGFASCSTCAGGFRRPAPPSPPATAVDPPRREVGPLLLLDLCLPEKKTAVAVVRVPTSLSPNLCPCRSIENNYFS